MHTRERNAIEQPFGCAPAAREQVLVHDSTRPDVVRARHICGGLSDRFQGSPGEVVGLDATPDCSSALSSLLSLMGGL